MTGSAITLKQATTVAAGSEKALPFTLYKSCVDPVNSSVFANATAVSNTFTTAANNTFKLLYRIPIDPASLDTANSFDCVRVGTGDAVNTTVTVVYLLKSKFGGNSALFPNFVVD